jgi:hypothetical protein
MEADWRNNITMLTCVPNSCFMRAKLLKAMVILAITHCVVVWTCTPTGPAAGQSDHGKDHACDAFALCP